MGKKRAGVVFRRRPREWPPVVFVLEPVWDTRSGDGGEIEVFASEIVVSSGIDGRFGCDPEQWCLSFPQFYEWVDAISEENQQMCFVGHDADAILKIIAFSREMSSRGWRGKIYASSKRVFFGVITRGKNEISIVDIRNYVPTTLYEIGAWVGVSIPDAPRWWPGGEPSAVDCAIVSLAVGMAWDRVQDVLGDGGVLTYSPTLAGAAYWYWSQQEECRVVVKPDRSSYTKLAGEAHYGGFCFASQPGIHERGPYYLLDCNGLYASICMEEKLPVCKKASKAVGSERYLRVSEEGYEPLVEADFSLGSGWLPRREGFRLRWDHGPRRLILPWPEVEWAMHRGGVSNVGNMVFWRMEKCLSETCRHFVSVRREWKSKGCKCEQLIYKLLSNSLYGKNAQLFGESVVIDHAVSETDSRRYHLSLKTEVPWVRAVWCGSEIWTPLDGDNDYYFPAISAWITSHARVRLWKMAELAGWDHVFYNDTDSLIVDQVGMDALFHLVDGDRPGALKIEAVSDHIDVRGEKVYCVGEIMKHSGLPLNLARDRDDSLYWYELCGMKGDVGGVVARKRWLSSMEVHGERIARDRAWREHESGGWRRGTSGDECPF